MLERFKVPESIAVRVPVDDMRATVESLFQTLGMPAAHAQQAADVLIYADTRGIDSHGVSNMTRWYVSGLKSGEINATPTWKITRDSGAAVAIDGDQALGLVVGPPAMDVAIERARQYGVGVVVVSNAGHYGAAAYHAQRAADQGMVGISMTTGGVMVVPTHGAEPLLGLNPIGVAAPAGTEPPFLFDASMSSVAGNKIVLLKRVGGEVAPGWVARPDGSPVMEEAPVPDGFNMLPLGGTRDIGSHKGYGLIMMVEVLTSLLGGTGGGPFRRAGSAHFFMALDVGAFTDPGTFATDMDEYLRRLVSSRQAPGDEAVTYPGLPEHETEVERRRDGIPYHPDVVAWFKQICDETGATHHL